MSAGITLSPLTTALVELRKPQPSNHKSQLEVKTTSSLANEKHKIRETRENTSDEITIGSRCAPDFMVEKVQ